MLWADGLRLLAFSSRSEERKVSDDAVAWAPLGSSLGEVFEEGTSSEFPSVALPFGELETGMERLALSSSREPRTWPPSP